MLPIDFRNPEMDTIELDYGELIPIFYEDIEYNTDFKQFEDA